MTFYTRLENNPKNIITLSIGIITIFLNQQWVILLNNSFLLMYAINIPIPILSSHRMRISTTSTETKTIRTRIENHKFYKP